MFRTYNPTITNGEHGSTTVDSSATWNRNGPITGTTNSFHSIITSQAGNNAVASGISFKEDKSKGIHRNYNLQKPRTFFSTLVVTRPHPLGGLGPLTEN